MRAKKLITISNQLNYLREVKELDIEEIEYLSEVLNKPLEEILNYDPIEIQLYILAEIKRKLMHLDNPYFFFLISRGIVKIKS